MEPGTVVKGRGSEKVISDIPSFTLELSVSILLLHLYLYIIHTVSCVWILKKNQHQLFTLLFHFSHDLPIIHEGFYFLISSHHCNDALN